MHGPDEHRQGKEREQEMPYWKDGILHWPDGTPVTNDDLARISPTTQITPHEPEPHRDAPKRRRRIEKLWN